MRYLLQFVVLVLVASVLAHLAVAAWQRRQQAADDSQGTGISNALLLAWVVAGSVIAMLLLATVDALVSA